MTHPTLSSRQISMQSNLSFAAASDSSKIPKCKVWPLVIMLPQQNVWVEAAKMLNFNVLCATARTVILDTRVFFGCAGWSNKFWTSLNHPKVIHKNIRKVIQNWLSISFKNDQNWVKICPKWVWKYFQKTILKCCQNGLKNSDQNLLGHPVCIGISKQSLLKVNWYGISSHWTLSPKRKIWKKMQC